MNYRPRIYYTEEQKSVMWDRWQKGESLQSIAQLFDRITRPLNGYCGSQAGYVPRPASGPVGHSA